MVEMLTNVGGTKEQTAKYEEVRRIRGQASVHLNLVANRKNC
jgi:hypothetical protein